MELQLTISVATLGQIVAEWISKQVVKADVKVATIVIQGDKVEIKLVRIAEPGPLES